MSHGWRQARVERGLRGFSVALSNTVKRKVGFVVIFPEVCIIGGSSLVQCLVNVLLPCSSVVSDRPAVDAGSGLEGERLD